MMPPKTPEKVAGADGEPEADRAPRFLVPKPGEDPEALRRAMLKDLPRHLHAMFGVTPY
jgi:hypothetical protein